jgi:hypothetical protein
VKHHDVYNSPSTLKAEGKKIKAEHLIQSLQQGAVGLFQIGGRSKLAVAEAESAGLAAGPTGVADSIALATPVLHFGS